MAPRPTRFAFVFGIALAMAVTILAITTWGAPPDSESESAAPIPPSETIYQPQYWKLF
jgi:hypothetical protein